MALTRAMVLLPAATLLLTALAATSPAQRAPVVPGNQVAAIVYTGMRGHDEDDDEPLPECEDDDRGPCEVELMVRRAVAQGAGLVVVSEAAFDPLAPEPLPVVGRRPPTEGSPIQRRFANVAAELGIFLVIQLELTDGDVLHSGQVAFDPGGRVVARHEKFELYDGEGEDYRAGSDVSVFATPMGRVGLLICSDIYGDPRLHAKLTGELGAQIIAFSSIWTVADATRWQAAFAHDWHVTLIAANGAAGEGRGAGIFDSNGHALAITHDGRDTILSATPR